MLICLFVSLLFVFICLLIGTLIMNTSKKDAEMAYEDHDFPLASRHYFHGSVYQVMDNESDFPKSTALKDIDNSIFTRRGAHYVAIRSGCSSTSGTHA